MKHDKHYFDVKGRSAERFVHDLARKTFLTDWCYLNPKLPAGKELCDLLVVFDDIAIIWQVKDSKLGKQGGYKESETQKNLRQLSGARRQLFDLGTAVELDNPRRGKESFDAASVKRVYMISVLLGEPGDVLSLAASINDNHVHVFTRAFTQIILNELDTISDFVAYLEEKERLVAGAKGLTILGGEEELLAYYLMNNRSFESFDEADHIMIEQGFWENLQERWEYQEKKKLDETSYGWDEIINRAHEGGSREYELVARELARPNRFRRRYLSKFFLDAHIRAHEDDVHDLFRRVLSDDGMTYCFLFADDVDPRERRPAMLAAQCFVARGKLQENTKVIGIATEKKIRPECSYDFYLLDVPAWTAEAQREMDRIQRLTGILVDPTWGHASEDEYPQRKD